MGIDPGLRRLVLRTLLAAVPGTKADPAQLRQLSDGLAGFTLFARNITDPRQLAHLAATLRAQRNDLLLALDEEGGDVTRLAHATGSPYPGNAALGTVNDPDLTRRVYRAIGTELATVGINLNLAPTVDVNTADDNPIIGTRSFGSDPATVATHTAAAVTGLQSTGVAACAKHFPGHGATVDDSHLRLPTVAASASQLRARDLPPFAAAIDADVQTIMTAHIRVPELTGDDPATFNRTALQLLRAEYGFTGVIITDALEMAGAAHTAGGIGPAAVRALSAGADLLCLGSDIDTAAVEATVAAIAAAVSDGTLPAARLEEAVARNQALAAWASSPRALEGADTPVDPDLGYRIARDAVRVEGAPGPVDDAMIVQLDTSFSIAEGRVPWGLVAHLPPGRVHVRAATHLSYEELARQAGDRPVVLVGRHLHRIDAARTLVEQFAAAHPCVVVEMGWPSRWRPAGARAFITSFGASHANGAAVTSLLFPSAPPPPAQRRRRS